MFLMLLLLHRLTLIIPPPPPHPQKKKRKLAKLPFCFIKNVHENITKPISFFLCPEIFSKLSVFLYSGEICPKFFSKSPAKLANFSMNLSLKIQRNLTFFSDLSEALCYERFTL